MQRVVKEWDILKKSLPNGIFLRCFEARIDVIKVLMIGTTGTPYCDLIFGFDIMAESDYPLKPPLIRHLSFVSEKMHPNLLENGSLCLSLLGTWSGKGSENWDPARSNILQLIVSVQGLLLGTPEPYYLEAGYDKQRGTAHGARSSRLYNENAYLLSIQSMIRAQTLTQEYKIFEPIIKMHFKERKNVIIKRCDKFLQSKPTDKEEIDTETALILPPSVGFLKVLSTLLPKLMGNCMIGQSSR